MKIFILPAFALAILSGSALPAFSAISPPVVKTVPWVSSNPLIPHSTWSGKQVTLKGTSDVQGADIQYTWDFGDGTPVVTGTVTNKYVVEAAHTYTGSSGASFTATLTITNITTGLYASQIYLVEIQDNILDTQVNVAVDEGLWQLHKTMTRTTLSGQDAGHWESGCSYNCSGYVVITPSNVTAFFVSGHLETSPDSDPYTETVQRGMRWTFNRLSAMVIGSHTYPAPIGTVNPDSNGNGLGVQVSQGNTGYQGGMFMGAIVASGTPFALTTTGPVNITGRTYLGVLQDMVDAYAWGQSYSGAYYGGWYYNIPGNSNVSDNSINKWATIGMIAAEQFGAIVPQWVRTANINSVNVTQNASGYFGYINCNNCNVWGLQALAPGGMVQMAFDGIGRGDSRWDRSENFMRNNFCNTGGAFYAVRDYYYGLLSFTQAMRLHDADDDGIPELIDILANQPGGANPIDWYSAESGVNGAQCNGVAKTLVNGQNASGYWFAHNITSEQYPFETSWAIIMLKRPILNVLISGAGTVTSDIAGIDCGGDCSEGYNDGTVVILTPSADADSVFAGWSGDCDADGQVTMDADKACTATFTLKQPDLIVTKVDGPSSVIRGGTIPIDFTVKNQGDIRTLSRTGIAFYLSTDTTITTGDLFLGKAAVNVLIPPGASVTKRAGIVINANTPIGNYYIGAIVDARNMIAESDDTNNAGYDAGPVTVKNSIW